MSACRASFQRETDHHLNLRRSALHDLLEKQMTEAPNPALQHSTPQQNHLPVLEAEIRYARVNWKRKDLQGWTVRGLLVWCIVSE